VNLTAQGNGALTWSPSNFLNTTSGQNVVAAPDSTIIYTVMLTTAEGCTLTDSVTINVFYNPPSANLPDTLVLCQGTSTTITAFGASTYSWTPNSRFPEVR